MSKKIKPDENSLKKIPKKKKKISYQKDINTKVKKYINKKKNGIKS